MGTDDYFVTVNCHGLHVAHIEAWLRSHLPQGSVEGVDFLLDVPNKTIHLRGSRDRRLTPAFGAEEIVVTRDGRELVPGLDFEFDRKRGVIVLLDEGTYRVETVPALQPAPKRKAQWKERFPRWGKV